VPTEERAEKQRSRQVPQASREKQKSGEAGKSRNAEKLGTRNQKTNKTETKLNKKPSYIYI